MSSIDTPSNDILNRLNRFHSAKLTGALSNTELSELITRVGDLIANCIRNGKIDNPETIREIKSHLPNPKYFKIHHEKLKESNKAFCEGNEMALSDRENRFSAFSKIKV